MSTSWVLSRELQKTLQIKPLELARDKQLLAVMVDGLELDALGFAPSWTIHVHYPPIHFWTLFL